MENSNEDDFVIETLDDPEWDYAIQRLLGFERDGEDWLFTKKVDLEPLSNLIANKRPVPEIVLLTLAQMLSPSNGWLGGQFNVQIPKVRTISAERKKIQQCMAIRAAFKNKQETNGGKWNAIVDDLTFEFGIGRTKVAEYIKMTDAELVLWVSNKFGVSISK